MKKFLIVYLSIIISNFCIANSEQEFKRLDSLSNVYLNIDKDRAIKYAIDNLYLAKHLENNELIANAYHKLGYIYNTMNDHPNAIYNYLFAVNHYGKYSDSIGVGLCYINLAYSYQKTKEMDKATLYNERAIKLLKRGEKNETIYDGYFNLSEIYREKGDYKKALSYLLSSYREVSKRKNWKKLALECTHVASMYRKIGKYDSALMYEKRSFEIGAKMKDTTTMARALNNLGYTYYLLEKYEVSINYLYESLRLDDPTEAGNTCLSLSDSYIKLNQLEKAKKYLNKAINKKAELSDIAITVKSLAISLKEQKNYKESIRYKDLYDSIRDSMSILASTNYNATYNSPNKVEDAERRYREELEQLVMIAENKTQMNQIILLSILVVIFLPIIIYLLSLQINKIYEKRKIISQVEKANELLKKIL